MLRLPDRISGICLALLAAAVALLVIVAAEPRESKAGSDAVVPAEAYETVADTGSVELIVNLRNSDVLSDVTNMLRSRGRGAAADRLEELFSARLDSVVQSLPADVTVEERYEFLGGLLISVRTSEALDALGGGLPNVLSIGVPEVSEPLLTESLALINQPEAAAAGYEGAGTAVAVLDTGVDY
ncbi:MAG TPA: hypothetical protein VFO84_05730, partial [Dehalococcoidia bacterium]|nr:hypothetical protein [Dehalococcoidia bacterium]